VREATPWERLDGVKYTLEAILESAVTWEQERIIEIIERCPRTDNDRLIDAPTLIALIKGEK
jgi:hypothetical protein